MSRGWPVEPPEWSARVGDVQGTGSRKLVYFVASTLDGFIAGPDGEFDFFPIEGPHQADLTERYPEQVPTHVRQQFGLELANKNWDTVLMGRGTYEPALRIGVTSPYAHLRQIVFSRSLGGVDDPAVEVVSGDPVELVRDLKSQPGAGIWLCGGGQLADQLLPEIDELVLKLYPMVIGSGIALLPGAFHPHTFTMVDHHVYDNGVALLSYRRAA
jgi:dihydrofolate reductase